jgi:hypothetical protein
VHGTYLLFDVKNSGPLSSILIVCKVLR